MAGIAKLKEYLKKTVEDEGNDVNISLGFAVGVFISFTPLLSIHTFMALGLAFLFRLNKISTVAGAWVNNYFTIPFVYYYSYRIGAMFIGNSKPPPSFEKFDLKLFLEFFTAYGVPLFLGTTITGLIAAFFSYYIMLYSVRAFRKRRAGRGGSGEGSQG